MDHFSSQPDEGYSEDPLNPLSSLPAKLVGDENGGAEFRAWLGRHINGLSIPDKTDLTMTLLNELPTSVIAQIVEQLNPRLYINFIQYLPPEICLKILGYLDPLSLVNVARSCRAWYDLALDRKLWEQLYTLEGWKADLGEVDAWERKLNSDGLPLAVPTLQRLQDEDGHAHKKRAISMSSRREVDQDMVMMDFEGVAKEASLLDTAIGRLDASGTAMADVPKSGPHPSSGSKGKGRAMSWEETAGYEAPRDASSLSRLPQSTLWNWDSTGERFRMNWKYLYTMRRRLESNWELGKYVNFQFPHPDYPHEGHGECIYTLQYNSKYLVSGSRDCTLKIWDMNTRRVIRTLAKHKGSVLCLQFDSDPDEDIIVSGSSDSNVIIWQFATGKEVQTLAQAHRESVLNVKFDKKILVTCSKDKTIKVFNRKPLHFGDLGYQEVDPVPRQVTDYGCSLNTQPENLPVTPAWTLIGTLEGHNAAVNAVQIHNREVISASGDRNIKVWDWPTEFCERTFAGHNKGIACVQYDGRRIVSGSSDNEVKVFDRHTALEVASLRAHSDLVRTVQAGFGDLPTSVEDDAAEAKRVDANYFAALESGQLDESEQCRRSRRLYNAGSKRPEDITAYGARLPPGGGGGKYGRIVSGSYDTSIIIWRRDKEGIWKDQHHLKQEEASLSAFRREANRRPAPDMTRDPSASNVAVAGSTTSDARTTSRSPAPATTAPAFAQGDASVFGPTTPQAMQSYRQMIDIAVPSGPTALAQALASYPAILSQRSYLTAAINSESNPLVRSQLRQQVGTALIRLQFEQAHQRRAALRNMDGTAPPMSTAAPQAESSTQVAHDHAQHAQPVAEVAAQTHARPAGVHLHQVSDSFHGPPPLSLSSTLLQPHAATGASSSPSAQPRPSSESAEPVAPPAVQTHNHNNHRHQAVPARANPARVFKLQFDARRIICCSQTNVIVGWDFCNDDPELEESSRFFAAVQ